MSNANTSSASLDDNAKVTIFYLKKIFRKHFLLLIQNEELLFEIFFLENPSTKAIRFNWIILRIKKYENYF